MPRPTTQPTPTRSRPGPTGRVRARVFEPGGPPGGVPREETLATEEPMEIRLAGRSLSVTMRTPGADFELAVGLLHAEGLLRDASELAAVRYCVDASIGEEQRYNVVTVDLEPSAAARDAEVAAAARSFVTTSACGVCGARSLDALHQRGTGPVIDDVRVRVGVLTGLPDRLRAEQRVFSKTGGLHAAGLFTSEGRTLVVR